MSSVPPPYWQPSAMPASQPDPQPPTAARRGPSGRAKPVVALAAAAVVAGGAFLLFGSSATRVNDPVAQAATISSSAAGYRIHMLVSFPSPSGGTPITGVGNGTSMRGITPPRWLWP